LSAIQGEFEHRARCIKWYIERVAENSTKKCSKQVSF